MNRDDEIKEAVIDILSDNEPLNQKRIREVLLANGEDVGEKKIRTLLNEMKADGCLSSRKGDRTEILYLLNGGGQNG